MTHDWVKVTWGCKHYYINRTEIWRRDKWWWCDVTMVILFTPQPIQVHCRENGIIHVQVFEKQQKEKTTAHFPQKNAKETNYRKRLQVAPRGLSCLYNTKMLVIPFAETVKKVVQCVFLIIKNYGQLNFLISLLVILMWRPPQYSLFHDVSRKLPK